MVEHFFDDPVSGKSCLLIVPADGAVFPRPGQSKIGVLHPHCATVADLAIELDAFYCPDCHWNGRISGAWAMETISAALKDRRISAAIRGPVRRTNHGA